MVIEGGLKVDYVKLKRLGLRGLVVAVCGSMTPLAIGTFLSWLLGKPIQTCIAIGACFAATSAGITFNIWEIYGNLGSDTGQVIIVAAIIDDVIALILLSCVNAMNKGLDYEFILSVLVSPVLIVIIGLIRIYLSARIFEYLEKKN